MRGRPAVRTCSRMLLTALLGCFLAAGTVFAGTAGSREKGLVINQGENMRKTIRQATFMDAAERERFVRPPEYYTDESGERYRLADWNVECIPGETAGHDAKKEVVYRAVEGAQVIPWQITVEEDQDGENARGVLEMTEKTVLGESWSDEFSVPVTFHSYGAEQYELGEIMIPAGQELPLSEAYREELLRVLGLKSSDYVVENMVWDGEPYVDAGGEVCRDAVAVGKKRVADYRVVYAGQIVRTIPERYCLKTVYELNIPVREPSVTVIRETTSEAEQPVPENENGKFWYLIRSGVVVTIAVGLFAILLGTIVLLAAWRREERRKKRK